MADDPPVPPAPPAPVPPIGPVAAALEYVIGDDVTPVVMNEEAQIKQILHWIGFITAGQKNAVYEDSISSYNDLNGLTKDVIDSMTRGYSARWENPFWYSSHEEAKGPRALGARF